MLVSVVRAGQLPSSDFLPVHVGGEVDCVLSDAHLLFVLCRLQVCRGRHGPGVLRVRGVDGSPWRPGPDERLLATILPGGDP